jgi:hypothetical protein
MAITITIVNLTEVDMGDDLTALHAWIKIDDGVTAKLLSIGNIPADLDNAGVQAYLDSRKEYYWQAAQTKGRPMSAIFSVLPERLVQRAVVELIIRELNVLRSRAQLPARDRDAWVDEFIARLQALDRR